VIVKRIGKRKAVKGGIIIPDSAKRKAMEGEVIAVGSGKREKGETILSTSSPARVCSASTAAPKSRSKTKEYLDPARRRNFLASSGQAKAAGSKK